VPPSAVEAYLKEEEKQTPHISPAPGYGATKCYSVTESDPGPTIPAADYTTADAQVTPGTNISNLHFTPSFLIEAMPEASFVAAHHDAAADTFDAAGHTASLRLENGSYPFVDVEKGAWVYLFYVPLPVLDSATKEFITTSMNAIAA
jgi:hypothetical protein